MRSYSDKFDNHKYLLGITKFVKIIIEVISAITDVFLKVFGIGIFFYSIYLLPNPSVHNIFEILIYMIFAVLSILLSFPFEWIFRKLSDL